MTPKQGRVDQVNANNKGQMDQTGKQQDHTGGGAKPGHGQQNQQGQKQGQQGDGNKPTAKSGQSIQTGDEAFNRASHRSS